VRLLNDCDDVIGVEDLVILFIKFDLRAAILGNKHAVAFFDFKRNFLSVVVGLAGAESDDDAFGGLFLGGIGNDDAALFDFFFLGRFDKNPVAERFDVNGPSYDFLFFCFIFILYESKSRRTHDREKSSSYCSSHERAGSVL
jgi:hypothetical protein